MLTKSGTLTDKNGHEFHYVIRSLNHVFVYGNRSLGHGYFSLEIHRRGDDDWCATDDANKSTFIRHGDGNIAIHDGEDIAQDAVDLWLNHLNEAFAANNVNANGHALYSQLVARFRDNVEQSDQREEFIQQMGNAWRSLTLDNTMAQAMTSG